jgi:hypothetical protein
LQNALAKVKIFLEEEPRNQKVKKMVNRKRWDDAGVWRWCKNGR